MKFDIQRLFDKLTGLPYENDVSSAFSSWLTSKERDGLGFLSGSGDNYASVCSKYIGTYFPKIARKVVV